MPRLHHPRTVHCASGELPMTSTQTWILIIAVCVIALASLIGLFRAT